MIGCKQCRSVWNENKMERCKECGSTELSDKFGVYFILIDPEKSEVSKELKITKKGRVALLFA
ncbi:MAG: transcription elongation factor subunit Spt4 [Candidatus Anstonellales archaeon]